MDYKIRKDVIAFTGELFSAILNDEYQHRFDGFEKVFFANNWFTPENVKYALQHWSTLLTGENTESWLAEYPGIDNVSGGKNIALVFAGNIPLVGFHDLLCCIACGMNIEIKMSSKDKLLPKWYIDQIIGEFPFLRSKITFTDNYFQDFDAVIATGSNNTGRYFDYYFGKYPHIIRRNRNSTAILTGNEDEEDLAKLADDIFLFFGLGCRSVSHIFVPEGYCFDRLLKVCAESYPVVSYHHKYFNNYEYQKAILQFNRVSYFDSGNLLLTENDKTASPVSMLHYTYYKNLQEVQDALSSRSLILQCIVGKNTGLENTPLGQTQQPKLNEYADGIDTLNFLLNL